MRSIHFGAAILLSCLASQAQAARFGYCYVDFGEGTDATRYVSGVIEIGSDTAILRTGGSFREAFLDHVRSRYETSASVVACDTWETPNDARRAAFDAGISGDMMRVRTNWLGGRREAGDRKDAKPPSSEGEIAPRKPVEPPVAAAKAKWEVDYEAKLAVYEQQLARQKAAAAEFERAQAELARNQREQVERARKARVEWERLVAACNSGDISACAQAPR